MDLPKVYIYLDIEGIESLYAQMVERRETEFTYSTEKGKDGKFGAKAGIGFKAFFNIGANADFSGSQKVSEQIKSDLTTEQKLIKVISNLQLNHSQSYYENINNALHECISGNKGLFINTSEKFNLPQFQSDDGVQAVNNIKAIVFESGTLDTYDYSDNYFRRPYGTRIQMIASLSKCLRSRNNMSYMGHDAAYFRAHQGINVSLNVFGYLTFGHNLFFQIKPFAIWL